MKETLELIITTLVDNKSSVIIKENADNNYITFEVKVDKDDMGKIIGKQGKIAKSIRNIIKALASKEGKRVSVEFIES